MPDPCSAQDLGDGRTQSADANDQYVGTAKSILTKLTNRCEAFLTAVAVRHGGMVSDGPHVKEDGPDGPPVVDLTRPGSV